jgi:polyvinyl alcohol dehydrogenase (cytochrome)
MNVQTTSSCNAVHDSTMPDAVSRGLSTVVQPVDFRTPIRLRFFLIVAMCIFFGIWCSRPLQAQEDGEQHAWRFWGANIRNTHSSETEHRLKPSNVNKLAVKWAFTTGGDVSATPTVEDGAVYVPDFAGNLFKIDAKTGAAIWTVKISTYTGNPKSFSRNSPTIAGGMVIVGDQMSATVLALDKMTGNLIWSTLVDPLPLTRITSSPVIFHNRIYVGVSSNEEIFAITIPGYTLAFRGSVRALDLDTGAVIWTTYTVPDGGDYTGAAVWGSNFAVDPKRNSLYVTTGDNYSVPTAASMCLQVATTLQSQLECLDPSDYVDSVLSLDLDDGHIKWADRLQGGDTFLVTCLFKPIPHTIPCPVPEGPDYDFGSGPNLFEIRGHENGDDDRGGDRFAIRAHESGDDDGGDTEHLDVVGAGQKSGIYWALDAKDGSVLWSTLVGPGGHFGGIEWGSAVDDRHIYVAIDNDQHTPYTLAPDHVITANAGSWAALDPASGEILWQIPATGNDPKNPAFPAPALGQVSAANGVVYAGSMSGDMVAIDGKTGSILWKFASGGSVVCGPSIVDGTVYWGSGYKNLSKGIGNNKLYAFSVPNSGH